MFAESILQWVCIVLLMDVSEVLTFRRVRDAADFDGLRIAALVPGHPGHPVRWSYDNAPSSVHIGAYLKDELIGCVSSYDTRDLDPEAPASVRLHSMAIDASVRGMGLGRKLLGELARVLLVEGGDFEILEATARDSAVGFYNRLGFELGPKGRFEFKETGFAANWIQISREKMASCLLSDSLKVSRSQVRPAWFPASA